MFSRSADARVTALVNRYGASALRKINYLNARQNALQLAAIFQPDTLLDPTARKGVLEKLSTLSELLTEYRQYYERYLLEFNQELLTIIADMPEEQQIELKERALARVESQLSVQAEFFELRASWIRNTEGLVGLMEAAGDAVYLEDGTLLFTDDAQLEAFAELTHAIDEVANAELALFRDRAASLTKASGFFGLFRR